MVEELSNFIAEIERIVTAPYIPLLLDLYDLTRQSSSTTISRWANQKPCQVGLLADVLVEGLSRSRVSLPLLSIFSSSAPSFQEAVLVRHPVLLDSLLEKVVEAGDLDYLSPCISLLSSPLPAEFVPPARITSFITYLVSSMAKDPCADTIMPLHRLMTSLQGSILNDVPDEVMSSLQLEFTKTLRNVDDQMGNLLCLATFARIAATSQNQHGSKPRPWLLNIQHFFGSKRGVKTLDLVVLRVILACSSNYNNLIPSQAAESIRLAICIADAVEPTQKNAWLSSNVAKISKLCDKVATDGLDQEIQMMGVAFLLCLCPGADLPPYVRKLGLHVLVSKGSKGALGAMPHYLIPRLVGSLANSEESAIYHLLRLTFETIQCVDVSAQDLSDLHLVNLILPGFQTAQSPVLISALLDSVSTREAIVYLLGLFPIAPIQLHCGGLQACLCAKTSLQNKVLVSLFGLYFGAAISRSKENDDVLIMKRFVDRAVGSMVNQECHFSKSKPKDFVSTTQPHYWQDNLSAKAPPRDWRSGIAEPLMQNAQYLNEDIVKKIEGICVDLERRCYDVEGPLRRVEEDRDRYISEAQRLKYQNDELEIQLGQSSQTVTNLQQEIIRLEEHAKGVCTRLAELSGSLKSTKKELVDEQHRSERVLHEQQEAARTRELDLIATCTEKEDLLEAMQGDMYQLESEIEQARQALDGVSQERAALLESSASLQLEVNELQILLEQSKQLCSQLNGEINQLQAGGDNMRSEIETLQTKMDEQTRESKRLYSSLKETEQRSRFKAEEMRLQHQAEANKAISEMEKQQEENRQLHTEIQIAAEGSSKQIQSNEKYIFQLENKIQSLRDERAAKAREFSEAQQHIGKLMNVMGFSTNQNSPPSKHQRTLETSCTPATINRRSTVYGEDDAQFAAPTGNSPETPHEPSPKRPKGSLRTMNPSQHVPKPPGGGVTKSISQSTGSPKRLSFRQLKPLGEVNPNSQIPPHSTRNLKHSQVLAQESIADAGVDHMHGLDLDPDLEFTKDFIFTSTAFSGSNENLDS
ncbi:hypothetical protein N7495_009658 [Penicillium taxi]|uniref:uncharacterized protein n=1 Tax=Penicillium taxi TaxID=168475 RepID=UPI00254560B1|nr:uncharacterized protein N7495_009658 [Penicillium taxi]KAJ5885148.1 hypothetical protein N7495_009658 [Penicillium taxi]